MAVTTAERAREALLLAEADPGQSVVLASAVVQRAREEHDAAAGAIAERAWGIASLHLEDLDTALPHLRRAIALGNRAGSPQLAAEARMTLAFALNWRGRSRQALREIDAALVALSGVKRARAQAQRGAILQVLGRLDDALASYRTAIPTLRRARDDLWLQRVLSNRGVLRGYRQEFAAAEADLHEAERLCEQLGLGLSVGFQHQNLGWLNALRGDVPVALHFLDLAEQRFRALQSQLGEVLADRSELLLSVRLVSEAREVAEQAVREFKWERRQLALPEVRMLLAQAATLDGDTALALHQAQCAVREFGRQQRPEWAALARFAVLASRAAGQQRSQVAVRQVERAADALAASAWPAAALEARLLAARLALDRGWNDRGRQQLARASRARRRGPATLRARAWHAEAQLRLAAGNRRGALIALRAGLRVLDEHRATLGATDLRAYASGHRTELAVLGLRIAMQDGHPHRALAWAEQGRASHLLLRPVHPPDDPWLANALAELRTVVTEIDERHSAARSTARLVQRQVALERHIRDYCRRQQVQQGDPTTHAAAAVSVRSLIEALGPAALLEFIQLDGTLHVLTIIDGQLRMRELGPLTQVRDLVDKVAFALHRLARGHHGGARGRSAAITLLRHVAARFDAMLLRPLADATADRPFVLIPTGPLQSLPWSILPSCAGRPVTVSPSAALWFSASRRRPKEAGHVAVAVGPGLPGARAEAEAVAAIYGTTALAGASATVEAVTAALDGAGLAHLAAHGRVHAQNPLFSSLRLADGPLTVYDLERLEDAPRLVVLSACDTGRPVVCAGDELLGLGATFLSHGTQQLVASVIPVPDAETAPLMVAFHRLLAAGHSPAEALGQAQQQVDGDEAVAMAAAAGFVCIGAGFTVPVTRPPPPPTRSPVSRARPAPADQRYSAK